jgi:hypothetical protein
VSEIYRCGNFYEAQAGAVVGVAIKDGIEEQKKSGENVYIRFNEVILEIRADSTFESVNRDYVYAVTSRRMKAGG